MIPQIGFGTWQITKDSTKQMVLEALNVGYTHIDCAHVYENEKQVGEAFGEFFKTHDRSKYWITSKLWNTNHHPDNVPKQLKQQLIDLQLQYLDLFIIHWPVNFKHGDELFPRDASGNIILEKGYAIQDTWEAMEKLVEQGLTKYIGVSNFNVALINDILGYCKVKPLCNQIEIHPFLQNDTLINYCISHGIWVVAYSPLGGSYGDQINFKVWQQDETLKKMCESHKKSLAQIILRWHVQKHPNNYAVIPKSSTVVRISENKQIFDFKLTEQEVAYINSLNKNQRSCDCMDFWKIPLFG